MAEGTSRLIGVLDSADVRASIEAVQALGATVTLEKQPDGSLAGGVEGWGAKGPKQPDGPIYCANSGTTARLLMGVLAPWDIEVCIEGDESLSKRPMRRITAPLMKMGVSFNPAGAETLPITERGCRELKAIKYDSPMAQETARRYVAPVSERERHRRIHDAACPAHRGRIVNVERSRRSVHRLEGRGAALAGRPMRPRQIDRSIRQID